MDPGNRLIAALDVPTRGEADALVARLGGVPSFYKLGLELFCAEGPEMVRAYTGAGRRVMLDLKLHDIPETVGRATARAADLGAELLTVHADGGAKMLEAAVKSGGATKILAITVLTSLDNTDLARSTRDGLTVEDLVERRAKLAFECGCAGVVCSPREVSIVRGAVGGSFLVVTPGVRPADAALGDQKRVTTPKQARALGADMVVIGRPLRDAADPIAAARAVVAELS